MADMYRSARLLYRAVETPGDNDFYHTIQTDPAGHANSNFSIAKPQTRASGEKYQKFVAEDAMLGVVICLPAPSSAQDAKPIPIGSVHLEPLRPDGAQHNFSTIGINVLPQYQGQGYGSEAIKWVLKWGFVTRGLHKVSIACFGYNPGAKRLYERLGFKLEGELRDQIWYQGKWYDDIKLGMLVHEWRELYGEKEA